ncbi:hypothetical protein E2C01_061719 [Portunus trituberculatus]|uniref:Uncharacterized protein n=1 Tax=Portunus trituberculatus TaxID=210409 RepID=A0A5B7H8X3_PORTR|nr:hypothetical protein [Portunus trituberculatus]
MAEQHSIRLTPRVFGSVQSSRCIKWRFLHTGTHQAQHCRLQPHAAPCTHYHTTAEGTRGALPEVFTSAHWWQR